MDKLDLLWRYYVQTGRRYEASRTLAQMAESTTSVSSFVVHDPRLITDLPSFDVPVARRCELLSAAVANAKASPSEFGQDASSFEFVTDMEEKLDVAKVQIDVEAAVRDLPADQIADQRRGEVLHVLQSRLLSITEVRSFIAASCLAQLTLAWRCSSTARWHNPLVSSSRLCVSLTWPTIGIWTSSATPGRRLSILVSGQNCCRTLRLTMAMQPIAVYGRRSLARKPSQARLVSSLVGSFRPRSRSRYVRRLVSVPLRLPAWLIGPGGSDGSQHHGSLRAALLARANGMGVRFPASRWSAMAGDLADPRRAVLCQGPLLAPPSFLRWLAEIFVASAMARQ